MGAGVRRPLGVPEALSMLVDVRRPQRFPWRVRQRSWYPTAFVSSQPLSILAIPIMLGQSIVMPIEAVVFDWGGVLAGDVGRSSGEIEQRLGVPAGSLPGLMGMHPCETDTENLWHMRELGRATSLEWAQWYSGRLTAAGGVQLITPEQMVATETVLFCPPQNTVVLDTVRQLHTDGYKLAICTNNWTELGAAWREGLPLDLFDAVVVSCEIGCRKPDAAMFNHVTDRLAVDPGSVVLVDDLQANVDGARRAGWHGVLVGSDHAAAMTTLAALLAEHPRVTHP
jgi:putative hydrolase of the HAD superfamily